MRRLPVPCKPIAYGSLADRCRWIRRLYGEYRYQFQKRTGVHTETLRNLEDGTVQWSTAIAKIAKATGYNPAWIQYGEPYAQPVLETDDE